jgi:hypothetical protein
MCDSCSIKIDDVWLNLQPGQIFRTPDHQNGVTLAIDEVTPDLISIAPQNIQISRESFISALHYLRINHHHITNPCVVGSSDDINLAGPLCRAARQNNQGQRRCINYILPILQNNGLVGIGCNQPNTAWLVNKW